MTRVSSSRSSSGLLRFAALASFVGLALASAACHRVAVDDVRGPDGADWKRVTCRHMDQRCFRAAAEMCPNGYYFAKADGPEPGEVASHHRSETEEQHVTEPRETAATSTGPEPGVNVRTLPPQEQWRSGMYSRKPGTILVQCAEARASAAR